MITTQLIRNSEPGVIYNGWSFDNEIPLFAAIEYDVQRKVISKIWFIGTPPDENP